MLAEIVDEEHHHIWATIAHQSSSTSSAHTQKDQSQQLKPQLTGIDLQKLGKRAFRQQVTSNRLKKTTSGTNIPQY